MSNTIMGLCWPIRELSAPQKAVLMALADSASDEGYCWISIESRDPDKLDLIRKTCLSKRAVQAACRALAEEGLIQRNEFKGDGIWYAVTPPAFKLGKPPKWIAQKMAEQEKRWGAPPAPAPDMHGAGDVGGGAPPAPNPSNNHQKISEAKASSSLVAEPKKVKKTASHSAPKDWVPKDAHCQKVAAFGWPDGMLEEQADRFREWEFKVAKEDWDLAFHRWLRTHNDDLKGRSNDYRSNQYGAGSGPGRGPAPRGQRIDAMRGGAMGAVNRFQRESR